LVAESSDLCKSVNGADGISDIEGKVARVSGEEVGKRPSFKSVANILQEIKWIDGQRPPLQVPEFLGS
jgi:hypothetical protein